MSRGRERGCRRAPGSPDRSRAVLCGPPCRDLPETGDTARPARAPPRSSGHERRFPGILSAPYPLSSAPRFLLPRVSELPLALPIGVPRLPRPAPPGASVSPVLSRVPPVSPVPRLRGSRYSLPKFLCPARCSQVPRARWRCLGVVTTAFPGTSASPALSCRAPRCPIPCAPECLHIPAPRSGAPQCPVLPLSGTSV